MLILKQRYDIQIGFYCAEFTGVRLLSKSIDKNSPFNRIIGTIMYNNSGYGPKVVREYNELNILRFIKNEGPISRAELAKRYRISKAAVSEIVGHLLQQGYIIETGIGSSTSLGGRKPILISFNPKSGYAIGVEIKRDHATVALTDLNAQINARQIIAFKRGTALELVIEQLCRIIDVFLKKRWIKTATPMGIGVAIPGLIDYKTGQILESDTLKNWQGFPIKDTFEKRVGIETRVENDVKANCLGECRFGNGKNVQNFVYLWIGDGLGAGIIINGELYRGISASAGEIGYYELGCFINNFNDYNLLYNGQSNFGAILSSNVLLDGLKRGVQAKYPHLINEEEITIESIFNAARNNCPLALEVVKEYGYLVGIVCINLINTLNPELILIGGYKNLFKQPLLLHYITEKIRLDTLRTPSHAVKIKPAALDDNAGILGAVGLILEDLFYMDRINIPKYRSLFGINKKYLPVFL